ncbi:Glutathione import ATP-binding protein GsiA [Nocardia cerradoensis]|uniref:Glutathione import ATP-binding protein GsiA n=1 Tax=Nocardia cerradoensis TaxID=85688 RepID=A0A231HDL3_9NOCA|nr:ABC transporter ATP-binding protein [Nocardia cerradoensis]OXR46912.1 Glutathione import ATP-binding protein GsiA [Nocardia cerradoensis]
MSDHSDTEPVEPLLRVRDLSVAFRAGRTEHAVLHHVDLDIAPGEIVALVGESGSGKSTLSRSVIGLLPSGGRVTGGSIRFAGRELTTASASALARLRGREIALVPQDPATSLNPVRTVGSQVAEIFRLHPDLSGVARPDAASIRKQSIALLDLVGIDRPDVRYDQYPHQLSGGMRQRVLLAIAFGLRPKLLIVDEPTSALDVTVQRQVLDVLDGLAHEFSVSVLLVTHNLAIATDRAHRVAVMRGGRAVETATVDDIIAHPGNPYSRELLRNAVAAHLSRPPRGRAGNAQPAVVVGDLGKVFDVGTEKLHAVRDVSFTVARGETFALVGESGSGKSTTAKLVLGLHTPSSGTVSVLGHDITAAKHRDRRELWRDIQLVYQNPQVSLDPRWNVERIVAEPLSSFGLVKGRAARRDRVREALDRVGLPAAVLDRRPRELSGGQQQRVALARALAVGARVLVLDEALSALDVVTQAQVLDLLHRLQDELELSYLFISHDLAVVRAIADSVAVMHQGRIVESGPVGQVLDNPTDPYTRGLVAAVPGHRLTDPTALAIGG